MKKILLVAAALLGTTAATAQVAPAQPQARDGIQTRTEAVERVRTMFARVDQNRDGAITAEERRAVAGQARHGRATRVAGRGERMFERLDTNNDNQISRAEWDAAQAQRGARMAQRGQRMGQIRQRVGGAMLRAADTNNDSRITLAEAEAAALQRFDRVDANRDGRITREERQQVRQQMREQRGTVRR